MFGVRIALAFVLAVVGAAAALEDASAQSRPARALRDADRKAQALTPREKPQGPLLLSVSLSEQSLVVYGPDGVLLRSPISSGQAGHETPTGVFSILAKSRYHESNIYSGAPMPFMQRLTWSGVALHAGALPGYPASHGCIRLPHAVADTLFQMTSVGARVVIAHEHLAPRQIEHPLLTGLGTGTGGTEPAPVSDGPESDSDARSDGGLVLSSLSSDAANASAAVTVTQAVALGAETEETAPPTPAGPRSRSAQRKPGPITALVSMKDRRLYVRRDFEPLFDMAVEIADPDLPIGTHVLTAQPADEGGSGLRWTVVSFLQEAEPAAPRRAARRTSPQAAAADHEVETERVWLTPPGAALARIRWPSGVEEALAELTGPGATLILTDKRLGSETGKATDLIVQMR